MRILFFCICLLAAGCSEYWYWTFTGKDGDVLPIASFLEVALDADTPLGAGSVTPVTLRVETLGEAGVKGLKINARIVLDPSTIKNRKAIARVSLDSLESATQTTLTEGWVIGREGKGGVTADCIDDACTKFSIKRNIARWEALIVKETSLAGHTFEVLGELF